MKEISTNYKPMRVEELGAVAVDAWKNADIPQRQYELAVLPELERFRKGGPVAPYDALVRCLLKVPGDLNSSQTSLLDAGCSSGYYSEVIDLSGFRYRYTGVDFSVAMLKMAARLYPEREFGYHDAGQLRYPAGRFDIVLSSAVIMHCLDYTKVVSEAVRVSREWVIFHRTPALDGPTRYFTKDAYGVPVIEVHFNKSELLSLFGSLGLTLVYSTAVSSGNDCMYRSYLLKKEKTFHVSV